MAQRASISVAFALSLVAVCTAAPPVVAQSTVTVSQPRLRISGDAPGGPLIGRMRAATIRADGGFVIAAYDQVQSRVSFYSASGAYLRQQQTEATLIFGCEADGDLVGAVTGAGSRTEQQGALTRFTRVGSAQPLVSDLLMLQMSMLGARMQGAVGAQTVAYGNGDTSTVTLLRTGNAPRRTISAGVANRPPTAAQRTAAIEQFVQVIRGTPEEHARTRRMLSNMPTATKLPAYSSLFIDDATRALWVERSVPGGGETVFERRTLDGALTALVRIPLDVRPFDVHNSQLLALFQDPDTGVEELRVYALPR